MTSNKTWLIFWTRGGTELKTKEKMKNWLETRVGKIRWKGYLFPPRK